jgi:phosphatidylserine/phosphatidylglycerophosphate/cardiolipin synthase-like enzyme
MAHPAAGWAVETTRSQFLGSIGHAIIHSKVLVVDPFSDEPTVVTGSHNFSPTASKRNDENFIVVRGDRRLAEAYAVNIDSAWRHYAGRAGNPFPRLRGIEYLRAVWGEQKREERFWRLKG